MGTTKGIRIGGSPLVDHQGLSTDQTNAKLSSLAIILVASQWYLTIDQSVLTHNHDSSSSSASLHVIVNPDCF